MRLTIAAALLIVFTVPLIAQSDRGTITGTVSDPTGAVVASAAIEARNTETGAIYPVAASSTGNYTIPSFRPAPMNSTSPCPVQEIHPHRPHYPGRADHSRRCHARGR